MRGPWTRCPLGPIGLAAAVAWVVGGLASADPPPAGHATVTVTIDAMRFPPESLPVHRGDEVVWINRDPFPHNVASASGRFRSAEIAPGRSFRHVVTASGVLAYGCTLHPSMHGELRGD